MALVGVAVSAGLLWWAVRGLNPGAVLALTAKVRPSLLLACVLTATATFPLRAVRWRLMLRLAGDAPLPATSAWHALAMGFMANNVLPFRAGELLRSYAVSRLARIPWTAALASIVVERVFDALTVAGLLTVALLAGALPAEVRIAGLPVAGLARRVGLLGLLGLGAGVALLRRPAIAIRLVRRAAPSSRLGEKLSGAIEGLRDGLAALRSPARLGAVALWSAAVWAVNAASFLLLFRGFGFPVGWAGALVVQAAVAFGVAIPSGPGFVGVFEAALVAGLGLYGIPRDQALAYAVTYHVTTFVPITALGLISLARTALPWAQVRRMAG